MYILLYELQISKILTILILNKVLIALFLNQDYFIAIILVNANVDVNSI